MALNIPAPPQPIESIFFIYPVEFGPADPEASGIQQGEFLFLYEVFSSDFILPQTT